MGQIFFILKTTAKNVNDIFDGAFKSSFAQMMEEELLKNDCPEINGFHQDKISQQEDWRNLGHDFSEAMIQTKHKFGI